jgi:hypothetical protein
MAGLDPAIHVFLSSSKTWMPGTRPGMTSSFCHVGFTITRNPSRGFGIGHICQSAL